MNTNMITNQTPSKEASQIIQLLVQLGKLLLKESKNAEWLDVDQICALCQKRGIKLSGAEPIADELEASLRNLFENTDELNISGISITGYQRRVGWDLVFMLRFYPDISTQPAYEKN